MEVIQQTDWIRDGRVHQFGVVLTIIEQSHARNQKRKEKEKKKKNKCYLEEKALKKNHFFSLSNDSGV